MWGGLLETASLAKLIDRLLAGQETIRGARHTPGRQHSQRAAANLAPAAPHQNPLMGAVMCLSSTPSMTDDGSLTASRTPARQPIAFRLIGRLIGLAFFTGTWDKDDHG
jgi:hypothetical protein